MVWRGKSDALKAQIRLQLQRKHIRFLADKHRYQLQAYWTRGAEGGDVAQQEFDRVDRMMRSEGWDDLHEWKSPVVRRRRGGQPQTIEEIVRDDKHSSAQRQYSAVEMTSDRPASCCENRSRAGPMRGAIDMPAVVAAAGPEPVSATVAALLRPSDGGSGMSGTPKVQRRRAEVTDRSIAELSVQLTHREARR
jgi:hypothetical protein